MPISRLQILDSEETNDLTNRKKKRSITCCPTFGSKNVIENSNICERYARCNQKITVFSIYSKSIYLFINNYLVTFKVPPLRYNTLMPAFFPILETHPKRAFC